ncbi:MAG: bifunctional hydroxymethylpyrimidine kinase/phosphomethylpyrimidine kinase, partial [Euryarchaeota archaeon]|nr:bifunctional hydroxymethylpyrimidine kinase/phosphomethylpyrimidine kinase [Euryarchaeota archaeon]
MRTVLTIAGSDSIGGAGVQADIKAIASLDLHGASVLTAITAQNTMRVAKIVPLETKDILAQIDAVLEDAKISAVKTGMLYSGDIARTVAKRLRGEGLPLVVDPVMVAGVGDELFSKGLLEAMRKDLFPMATVVTPNRHEAEKLASMTIDGLESTREACMAISDLGPGSVLIKGGHFEGDDVVDVLYHEGRTIEFAAPRSPNKVHGAGCTLASYIAGNISKGMDIRKAVLDAKRRITDAIALSYRIGGGMNAINPMASKQKDALRGERIE